MYKGGGTEEQEEDLPLFEINIKSSAKSVFYFCGPQELKDAIIHV